MKEKIMTTQTTLTINGMTCGGCVNGVTNALKQVDGVNNVQVSLTDKNAVIDFDDSKTNVNSLKEAIEDAGYDVV